MAHIQWLIDQALKNLCFENRLSQCAIYEVAHIANLDLILRR